MIDTIIFTFTRSFQTTEFVHLVQLKQNETILNITDCCGEYLTV